MLVIIVLSKMKQNGRTIYILFSYIHRRIYDVGGLPLKIEPRGGFFSHKNIHTCATTQKDTYSHIRILFRQKQRHKIYIGNGKM